ncbi:MAG TPA: transcriptional repressor [Burkholderiales bacterium]|nr:transcriptional repressor [Burkholderiales bacterium]
MIRKISVTEHFVHEAEIILRKSGAPVTVARIHILAMLISERRALSHHDIRDRLKGGPEIDRVTIYRVLEWLCSVGLAHQVASHDRLLRFGADPANNWHQHAHFRCISCDEITCLDGVQPKFDVPLPLGYRLKEMELTVRGLCPNCNPNEGEA